MGILTLLVCLATSPEVCRFIAAEWLEEHPKWTLKGWRCRSGAREKST
jgi:hypothetical protein